TNIDERNAARTVWPLDHNLLIIYRNAGSQNLRHGTFRVCDGATFEAKHAVRAAKSVRRVIKLWRPTPEFGGAAVVKKNQTVRITNIDGNRQQIEQRIGQRPFPG